VQGGGWYMRVCMDISNVYMYVCGLGSIYARITIAKFNILHLRLSTFSILFLFAGGYCVTVIYNYFLRPGGGMIACFPLLYGSEREGASRRSVKKENQ
jgi:hypothetical protein